VLPTNKSGRCVAEVLPRDGALPVRDGALPVRDGALPVSDGAPLASEGVPAKKGATAPASDSI